MTRATEFRRKPQTWMRTLFALLAALLVVAGVPGGPPAAHAWVTGVDLTTDLWRHHSGPHVAGAPTSVGITLGNNGSHEADNLTYDIVLPPGTEWLPPFSSRCTFSASTLRCTHIRLRPLGSAEFDFNLRFPTTGTFVLTSSATADQPDADGDSSGEVEVEVVEEEADLAVVGSIGPAEDRGAHRVQHAIANRGPTDAGPVLVTGTFPTGGEHRPGTFFLGTDRTNRVSDLCDISSTGYVCGPLSGIPSGDRATVRYSFVPDQTDRPGPIEASITVTGRNDPDPANNTSTTVFDEDAAPVGELSLLLSASDRLPDVGEPVDVRVSTYNPGEVPAAEVEITVEVPPGWTIDLPQPPRPVRPCEVSPTGRWLHCTYRSVPASTIYSFDAPVTPPADRASFGRISGELETISAQTRFGPKRDVVDLRAGTIGADIVAAGASHSPEDIHSGIPARITWTFVNNSPEFLVDRIAPTVVLPPDVSASRLSVERSGGGGSCSIEPDVRIARCPEGPVTDEQAFVVELDVVFRTGGSFPFTATLSQTSGDRSPGDESLTHTVEVETGLADLQLTASLSDAEVAVGATYSYVVGLRNAGTHPATPVVLSDELPANVEVVSAYHGWNRNRCAVNGNRIDCYIPEVAAGVSTFAVVEARTVAKGTAASAPTVSGNLPDPDPSSNTLPVAIEVVEPGDESPTDLTLTARPPDGPVNAGEPFTTVVEIENDSTRAATGVTLALDDDPTNVEVVSATQGWFRLDCATDGTTICTIPTIYAGGSTFVEVTTGAPAPGPFAATLTIGSDLVDADPADNAVTLAGQAVAPG